LAEAGEERAILCQRVKGGFAGKERDEAATGKTGVDEEAFI
jgi:hypothetical protein